MAVMLQKPATRKSVFIEILAGGAGGVINLSEIGLWLKTMAASHIGALKETLTEFYDVPELYRYKTKNSGDWLVRRPYISINGVSTLAWLEANIESDDIESGFLARFLILYPPQRNDIPDALPQRRGGVARPGMKEFGRRLYQFMNRTEVAEPLAFRLSADAVATFTAIHNGMYDAFFQFPEKTQQILNPFVKRWSPSVLKLAMLFQVVGDGGIDAVIRPGAVRAGWTVVEYAMRSTLHLFRNQLGETPHQRKCRKVKEYIAKQGGSVTWKKLRASKTLDGGSKDYEYPLETLIDTGDVEVINAELKKDRVLQLGKP